MNRATRNLKEDLATEPKQTQVARIIGMIEHEHELAAWAATGVPDEQARKVYIRRRYQAIGKCREQLSQLVGDAQANRIVQATIEKTPAQKQKIT